MPLVLTLALLIVFIVVLIHISGWFSGTETALTNLSSATIVEMRRNNERNIGYIIKLKRNMDRTLITILIGNNIVNIILSAVAALMANALFHTMGVSIVLGIITFLLIIFGEITPKHTAIMDSGRIAKRNARAIYFLMKVLDPFIDMFMFLSKKIIILKGGSLEDKNLLISEESIMDLATLGEEEGVIKSIERDIIHKVFKFGDRKVVDIMVPISNVFYLEKNYSIRHLSKIIVQHGFTRVPVLNKEKVVGIVYSKDLIGKTSGKITTIMRTPHFVLGKNDISDIFNAMRRKRIHMAIVKNKSGDHIGIVTLEDILEEIVGEIHDEYYEVKYRNGNNVKEMLDQQAVYNGDVGVDTTDQQAAYGGKSESDKISREMACDGKSESDTMSEEMAYDGKSEVDTISQEAVDSGNKGRNEIKEKQEP